MDDMYFYNFTLRVSPQKETFGWNWLSHLGSTMHIVIASFLIGYNVTINRCENSTQAINF